MNNLITNIHRQWLTAKEHLAQRCANAGNMIMADKLSSCEMFKGTESVEEVMRLFRTAQGLEFCIAANFPNIATLRRFKRYNPERMGIYIDAGDITLTNPGKIVLIGHTIATIKCDTCERHEITALHGASASVIASGWAVVATTAGRGCNITRRASENAIILC